MFLARRSISVPGQKTAQSLRRPSATNLPGIDAVLFDGDALFLIQLTVTMTCRGPAKSTNHVQQTASPSIKAVPWHVSDAAPDLRAAKS